MPAAGARPLAGLVRLHYVTECDSISHGGCSPVLQYESTQGNHPMQTITERASKAEVISNACEAIDHQAATIERLQQQQQILWAALAVLTAWALL